VLVSLREATDGVTLFFLPKTDDLFSFFSHRLWKVMTFLAVVSSSLPSSYVVCKVCFLISATKTLILAGRHLLKNVTRGGPSHPPLVMLLSLTIKNRLTQKKSDRLIAGYLHYQSLLVFL